MKGVKGAIILLLGFQSMRWTSNFLLKLEMAVRLKVTPQWRCSKHIHNFLLLFCLSKFKVHTYISTSLHFFFFVLVLGFSRSFFFFFGSLLR